MEQCLFCLEETSEDNVLIQVIFANYFQPPTCSCKVMTHVGCWMAYYVHKTRTECPICHKIYDVQAPTPPGVITTFDLSNRQQPIRVVVVANEEIDHRRCTTTVKSCSLFIIISFGLFLIIMHYV